MEMVTWAVLLAAGAFALYCAWRIGEWYGRGRPMQASATHWTVIERWENGPDYLFETHGDAKEYIDNAIAYGNADAHDYVVRGVVLLREEGDPR